MITITLNGEASEVPAGLSLAGLVEHLGRDLRTVAIEYNGEIVGRETYDQHRLAGGDRLEIVHFVQGG